MSEAVGETVNPDEEWRTWDLHGLEVWQLCIDSSFTLLMGSSRGKMGSFQGDLYVIFETRFEFQDSQGNTTYHDPEDTASLADLLDLFTRPVAEFRASSEGKCILRFEEGMELRSRPHQRFEAWQSKGTGSLSSLALLCGPGGGSPWGD